VKGTPWTYTVFGVKEVHRVKAALTVTDNRRALQRALGGDRRSEVNPHVLLLGEYGGAANGSATMGWAVAAKCVSTDPASCVKVLKKGDSWDKSQAAHAAAREARKSAGSREATEKGRLPPRTDRRAEVFFLS